MKKVLFTATVDSHILQFHIPYLEMFKENGYEVHVATNGTEEIPYCDVKHVVSFERSPIKTNNLKAIKQLKKIINEENFEIIHCHTPMGSVVTRIAAKKSRKRGTRVIYTAHGFHFFKGAPIINWLIFYPIEKYLSKYTDCLITINQEDYDIAKKKFKAKQTELVHGIGIDESKFNFEMLEKEKHELRQSLGLKDDDFVLIQVGELNKNKNQIMSINAMQELVKENSNIHLLLVGQGELESYYRKKINKYNLQNNIHMLGYRKDIPELMKISDCLLSLSFREGLPVNVLEGMICKLPIIATDCRGNRDLSNIIIKNNNALIDSILKCYNKQETEVYCIDRYLTNNIKKQMKQIYENVQKKKILHLLSTTTYSGAENVACQIIQMFKKEEKILMYYCSPIGSISEVIERKNFSYLPIKKISYKYVKQIVNKENIDIIHAHDVRASFIASFFSRNIKVISHIHGNHMFMRKITIKSILYHLCSKRFDSILWVSKSSLENYRFINTIKSKSHILTNVIDINEVIEKSNQYDSNSYDIAYIGRLSEAKNPIRMLNIIKILSSMYKNFKCVIIGDGELKEEVKEKIKEMQLSNYIELKGYIENPFPILKKSKLLIMTSTHEGTPMIALEALGIGIPIISTPTDGMIDLVDEKVGFLSNKDKELAKSIQDLLKNENKRKLMSKMCKEKFIKVNDIMHYKEKIKEIYG